MCLVLVRLNREHGEMNVSESNREQQAWYRDSFIKNLTVVLLGIIINYINASMVHAFHQEEVTTLLECQI